jgi:hypothetical protein
MNKTIYRGDFLSDKGCPLGCDFGPGMELDPADGPRLFQAKTRLAQKPHTCCECREEIPQGTPYLWERGLWEAGFQTFRTCHVCKGLRDILFPCGHMYTRLWADLWDHLAREGGQIPETCVAYLPKAARSALCELIEIAWAHYESTQQDEDEEHGA